MLTTSIAKTFSDDHQLAVEDRRQLQLYDQEAISCMQKNQRYFDTISCLLVLHQYDAAIEQHSSRVEKERATKSSKADGAVCTTTIDIYELRHDEAMDCTSVDITATDDVLRVLRPCETLTSHADVSCAKRNRTY